MKISKIILTIIVVITTILAISLYNLSHNPIQIPNNFLKKLASSFDVSINCEDAQLKFDNFKLQVIAPKIILNQETPTPIIIDDFNLSLSIFNFKAVLTTKIINSEMLSLIKLKNQPKIQTMIDTFNRQNHFPLDGNLKANFNFIFLKKIELNLNSNSGWHSSDNKKLKQLKLNKLNIAITSKNDKFSINQFQIIYENNIIASLNGEFAFDKNGLSLADFKANVSDLPIDYLSGLWPEILFPEIHQWISSHITNGKIKQAHGAIKLTAKDFRSDSIIPKEAINAEIEVIDATVIYLEGYNPIKNINGIIKIDGEAMHINIENASHLNNSLKNINLTLPFSNLILSLNAIASGKISNFQEFIPLNLQQKLERYGIIYKNIKGNVSGSLDLRLPVDNTFDIKNLKLDIKASFDNVIVDKLGIFELKKGSIELTNENDKIKLKINHKNSEAFNLVHHHNLEQLPLNQMSINTEIDINKVINLGELTLNKGSIKVKANLSEDKWDTILDFSKAEITFNQLGYIKPLTENLTLECLGNIEEVQIISDNCSIGGKSSGKILFTYANSENPLKRLIINNAKIGPNQFNLQMFYDKNFSTYNINAKTLDLSNATIEDKKSLESNYKASFKIDQVLLKNQVSLSNANGSIKKIINNPPEIKMSAFTNSDKITLSRAKKNNKDFYFLHSTSAAAFSKAFGIYNNIKKGELWIELYPEVTKDGINYNGNVNVTNFYLTNTSILTKIILGMLSPLNSPQAMARALQGGSLKADSFTVKLAYKGGILKLNDGSIKGTSYEVKLNGYVDFPNKNLNFKGLYIPSFYGINTIISSIPLLGKLLSGGDKSAFLAANFGVTGNFDNPKTSFNPLSALTPGFIRNLFN